MPKKPERNLEVWEDGLILFLTMFGKTGGQAVNKLSASGSKNVEKHNLPPKNQRQNPKKTTTKAKTKMRFNDCVC